MFLKVFSENVHNRVAVYDVTVFVYGYTTVGIAVKCETCVKLLFTHQFTKAIDARRTAVEVDVFAVRLVSDNISFCAKRIEYAACYHPCAAVCTIEPDAFIFK